MSLEKLPDKVANKYYNKIARNCKRYITTLMSVTPSITWGGQMNENRLNDGWGALSFYQSSHFDEDFVMKTCNEMMQITLGLALAHLADKQQVRVDSRSVEGVDAFVMFGRAMVRAQAHGDHPRAMQPFVDRMYLYVPFYLLCFTYFGVKFVL